MKADHGNVARRELALDHAVAHEKYLVVLDVDHRSRLGVVDEIDTLAPRIGHEHAPEVTARHSFRDLDVETFTEFAKRAFLQHERNQVGAGGADKGSEFQPGERIEQVADGEG